MARYSRAKSVQRETEQTRVRQTGDEETGDINRAVFIPAESLMEATPPKIRPKLLSLSHLSTLVRGFTRLSSCFLD